MVIDFLGFLDSVKGKDGLGLEEVALDLLMLDLQALTVEPRVMDNKVLEHFDGALHLALIVVTHCHLGLDLIQMVLYQVLLALAQVQHRAL